MAGTCYIQELEAENLFPHLFQFLEPRSLGPAASLPASVLILMLSFIQSPPASLL